MKKLLFGTLFIIAALVSCSKPENDGGLASLTNDQVEAVAVDMKSLAASVTPDFKGISDTCNSKTYTLLAGKTTNVGNVVVSNDLNFVYVTYNTTGGWELSEVHLYALDNEPAERLTPGQAPFKSGDLPKGTTTYTFIIPLSDTLLCGSSIWLQAHAAVGSETAYGGTIVPKPEEGSWYGNIFYTIECCEKPEEECKISASGVATDVKCYGTSTGAINLTVSDGTAPFSFLWSNGAATEDLVNIPAGTYSVIVNDDKKCSVTVENIVVLQPASAITASAAVTNITVFDANDGKIDATISGGTAPYTLLWSNGLATEDVSGLAPGTYTLTITDSNGCIKTVQGTVNEGNCPEFTLKGTLFPALCNNNEGKIDLTVTGGTAPYTYLWSNGATTEDLLGLSTGVYSVVVTDAYKCTGTYKTSVGFDLSECNEPVGIVAFARKTYEPMVHCFIGDPLLAGYGFTQWGWTNGALPEAEGFISRYELFINAGSCDVDNAIKVGDMTMQHFGGVTKASITLLPGYTMSESKLYVGNDILPKVGGDYTVDPASYPYSHSLASATADSYTINGITDEIFIIGYVVIDNIRSSTNN